MRRITRAAAVVLLAAGMLSADVLPLTAEPVRPEGTALAFPVDHYGADFWNSYGARRSGGRSHRGIDIMGEKMYPIVAIADGIVEEADVSRRSGVHVYLRHGNGWESWYMHLNNDSPGTDDGEGAEEFGFAPGIEDGAFVEAGQLIGWMGDSGNAEGKKPHLHIELLKDGRNVNPHEFLDEVWDMQLREWGKADVVR